MKKNLTELVFILDRSGSMSGLEEDTIGGFNSMIKKQKKEEGEALISTVLFDNVCEVLHDRTDIREIRPMTEEDYYRMTDSSFSLLTHIQEQYKASIRLTPQKRRELAELAGRLEQSGRHDAYEKVMAAVADFEKGNSCLADALSELEGA